MKKAKARSREDLEFLATFVHGVLAAFHGLAVIYHIKRRRFSHAAVHTVALAYDGWSVRRHFLANHKHQSA
jgi:hypothetical protein